MPARLPVSFRLMRAIGGFAFILGTLAPGLLAQQDTVPTPAGAPVVFHGDTILRIVAPLGPFTPAERAQAAVQRMQRLVDDPLVRDFTIELVETENASNLVIGEVLVATVTEADAAAAGVDRRELAATTAEAIQSALHEWRGARSLRRLLIGAGLTLVTTIVALLIFLVFNRLFPALYRLIDRSRRTRIPALRIQRLEVFSADRVADALLFVARALRIVAVIVVLYVYLPLVFSFFPWTRHWGTTIFGYVLNPLLGAWRAFVAYLPNLFTVAVLVAVFYYLLRFIRLLFTGLERGAVALPGFHIDWALPTYKIVRFLVIVFAAVIIFPYLPGSDTEAFKGISIFLGVLISFGSSSAIANVVAGVVMTYMRPFQLGDRVRIADTMGDIVEKTLLITRIRTPKNVDITVPNAMVLSSHIINYSSTAKEGGLILHTSVTIGYDAPWRQVHQLLIAAAEGTDGVLAKPEPFVLQTALDDFYVKYELNAYTSSPNAMARIYSDLHQNIQDRFNEAGVEIMSPHYRAERDGSETTIPRATGANE